jgi:putative SOS response-associated peptidase YedK
MMRPEFVVMPRLYRRLPGLPTRGPGSAVVVPVPVPVPESVISAATRGGPRLPLAPTRAWGHSAVMCGRFNVIDNPQLRNLLEALGVHLQGRLPAGVNIAPTDTVPLVREVAAGERELIAARWWLTPGWAPRVEQKYAMFNARSETLGQSRAYRKPFHTQRGVMPMSNFIEWRLERGRKQPWLVTSTAGAMAAAALWDVWEGDGRALLSCTLVTCAAAPAFRPWHTRMPLMLAAEEWSRWLDNRRPIADDDPLFTNRLKSDWRLEPLAPAINRTGNRDPGLLTPAGESVTLPAAG